MKIIIMKNTDRLNHKGLDYMRSGPVTKKVLLYTPHVWLHTTESFTIVFGWLVDFAAIEASFILFGCFKALIVAGIR